jgi:hypothetical protein
MESGAKLVVCHSRHRLYSGWAEIFHFSANQDASIRASAWIDDNGVKGLWQSERRERELRHDSIADVVLEKKQVKGRDAGIRYWVEYVTTEGERIPWNAFTSSKDDKLECIRAVREFLGIVDAPAAANQLNERDS